MSFSKTVSESFSESDRIGPCLPAPSCAPPLKVRARMQSAFVALSLSAAVTAATREGAVPLADAMIALSPDSYMRVKDDRPLLMPARLAFRTIYVVGHPSAPENRLNP